MTLDYNCDGLLVEWSDDRADTRDPGPPEDIYLPEPALDIIPVNEE
jgi:hypothetical protein